VRDVGRKQTPQLYTKRGRRGRKLGGKQEIKLSWSSMGNVRGTEGGARGDGEEKCE